MDATPEPAARHPFREPLLKERPRRYSGILHFAVPNVLAWGGIALAASHLHDVRPLEWLALPAGFLIANFVEWLAHKGPMHNRRAPLDLLFERHTLLHHEYFRDDSMDTDGADEWFFVLFPMWGVAAVIVPAILLGLLANALFGLNVGLLTLMIVLFYYIFYEWLHLIYHLPAGHWAVRNPVVRAMQRHHRHHHNKRLMQRYNFNVTFPICDYLFGTAWREKRG